MGKWLKAIISRAIIRFGHFLGAASPVSSEGEYQVSRATTVDFPGGIIFQPYVARISGLTAEQT